ncbi:MAG: DUF3362 domain-containing protein, partial [Eggerthellaceae bacterium]
PEHVSDAVLSVMGKPRNLVYQRFAQRYEQVNRQLGMKQFLVPYLMSSHPGSTLDEAVELAEYCRDLGYMPEQVQDFYPTPSTMSTAMYYTGVDPPCSRCTCRRAAREGGCSALLIQYRDPKNRDLVLEALRRAARMDLVGYGPKCLLRPQGEGGDKERKPAASGKGARTRADVRAKAQSKPNDSGKAPSKARPSGPERLGQKPKPSSGKTSSQGGGRSGKSAGNAVPGKVRGLVGMMPHGGPLWQILPVGPRAPGSDGPSAEGSTDKGIT